MNIRQELLVKLNEKIINCTKCSLCKDRIHAVPGEGPLKPRLMVVGEGPGRTENETGRPFVGPAGNLLNNILNAFGIKREHVFITNVVRCRPPNNRQPTDEEIKACSDYLTANIKIVDPEFILLLGSTAAKAVLGMPISYARGTIHNYMNKKVIATYHPSYLLQIQDEAENKEKRLQVCQDMKILVDLMK